MCLANGIFYEVPEKLASLRVFVVNFDGQIPPYISNDAFIGEQMLNVIQEFNSAKAPHLGYTMVPPSEYGNNPMNVRQAVYDFKAYAAVIINANATALLRAAVEQGNDTYDPSGVAQIIYVSARDQTTVPTYVAPQLGNLERAIISQVGLNWTQSVLQNTSISRENLQKAPQALSPGIGFTTIDLRPFGPPEAVPVVTTGLVYLIIIAFFSFTFFTPTHMKFTMPRGHPPLHYYQLIIWRWFASMVAYFLLSLAFSLTSLAFRVPFSNSPASPIEPAFNPSAYGRGTFVVYWILNFVGMAALGLACENVAMALGPTYTAMWLTFWVIVNTAASFSSLDLAPRFYRWGYALPLHNVVEASHQLLFNLHSRIGLNFEILFAWVAVDTAIFPFACYVMRWGQEREQRLKEEKDKRWMEAMSTHRTRLGFQKDSA